MGGPKTNGSASTSSSVSVFKQWVCFVLSGAEYDFVLAFEMVVVVKGVSIRNVE